MLDNKVYNIGPRTLVFFQPFQIHKINMVASLDSPYERTVLVIAPVFLKQYLKQFPSLLSFFNQLLKEENQTQLFRLNDDQSEKLLYFFSYLNFRLKHTNPYEFIEDLVISVLPILRNFKDLFRLNLSKKTLPPNRFPHTEKIMEWVESHYHKKFSLEELSQDIHLSPSHISRTFHKEVGCSLIEYISVRRIRQACFLLSTTVLSVQEISMKIGLKNDSYFIQLFKKHMGTSPNKYRKASKRFFQKNLYSQTE